MSTSSGFSNFIPRFNKTKDSPSFSSGPSLSPSKDEPRSRRSSFSLSSPKRSPSPSPSPALSTKSSFSDFALSSRSRNQDASQSSDSTARIKAPAPPPKLTLTDVEHSESSIHVPSPISSAGGQGFQQFGSFATPTTYDFGGGMSGSLGSRNGLSLSSVGGGGGGGTTMGWEDEDQIRTPTGDRSMADGTPSALGLGFGIGGGVGGLGEGSLTLEDATSSGGGGRSLASNGFTSSSSSSAPSTRPNSFSASDPTTTNTITTTPPKPSSSSTRSDPLPNGSAASSISNSSTNAQAPSFPTPSTSQSSLNGLLSSSSSTLDPPKPSKRRLSTSSSSRKSSSTKPSGGIAAAIASMSKDLVNPAANMVVGGRPVLPPSHPSSNSLSFGNGNISNRASSPTPTNRSSTFSVSNRPRAGTGGASIPSSITSEDSRKSTRSNKSSMKSLNTPLVQTPRTSIDDARPSRDSVESAGSSSNGLDANTSLGGGPYGEMNGNGGTSELGDYDSGSEEDEEGMGGGYDDENDDDELDDLPVTGFAVASAKRNHDFHLLFKEVPEVDYLIEDYGCALQRDILVQGRLYVSENHVCFHASIFGWVTNMVIPFSEILRVDKKMTAFVIPNAIMISTLRSKYTWASFLSRDTTYDVIHNIWRLSHPHLPSFSTEALTDDGAQSTNGQTNSQGSVGEDYHPNGTSTALEGSHSHASSAGGGKRHLGGGINTGGAAGKRRAAVARKPTTCACGLKGEHYSETALDAVFPSTPEKIYNLMFTSGFAKDFMSGNQKLMDIQTSDWAPSSTSGNNLTRKMSYIKPLPGGFGPKQTKCELQDETVHVDFDEYVSMVTTTRTPDVPSGGSFSVKTRTCLMWAGGNSTRVLVTCQVDWTGRSFIRGIIDSSALAGQKSFHADQETAMRLYITDHLTEFHTEGLLDDDPSTLDLDPLSPTSPAGASPISHTGTPTNPNPPDLDLEAKKLQRANEDGWFFQYGVDTFSKGFLEIFKGLWAIIESLGSGLTMQGFFGIVIAGLLVSNVWTFLSLRGGGSGREEGRGPPGSSRRVAGGGRIGGRDIPSRESPDSVAEAVKSFLEDYITRQDSGSSSYTHSQEPLGLPEDELSAISSSLDALERRIELLRSRLPSTRAIGSEPSPGGLEELD